MSWSRTLLLLLAALVLISCGEATSRLNSIVGAKKPAGNTIESQFVTMDGDGTILLHRKERTPAGLELNGIIGLRPGEKDYNDVLNAVGTLKPGEQKNVPLPQTK